MTETVDTVIVGAGPAGLAAATALRAENRNFRLIEVGEHLKNRNPALSSELARGVGGAGLYSDGKFSFFPSATELWKLGSDPNFNEALTWFEAILQRVEVSLERLWLEPQDENSNGVKRYPSIRVPFQDRQQLIQTFEEDIRKQLVTSTALVDIEKMVDGSFRVRLNNGSFYEAKGVIWCTGRYGAISLQKLSCMSEALFSWLRLEVGCRLIQSNTDYFLAKEPALDPKLKGIVRPDVTWRTFCSCYDGELVTIEDLAFTTVSGRADRDPTGRSNVGLNVRYYSKEEGLGILNHLLIAPSRTFRMPLDDFLEKQEDGIQIYGQSYSDLKAAVRNLCDEMNINVCTTEVAGPCIEGIGSYPIVDDTLRIPGLPFWVCGDSVGIFRGLTAAFLSGYYCGLKAGRLQT